MTIEDGVLLEENQQPLNFFLPWNLSIESKHGVVPILFSTAAGKNPPAVAED